MPTAPYPDFFLHLINSSINNLVITFNKGFSFPKAELGTAFCIVLQTYLFIQVCSWNIGNDDLLSSPQCQ